MSGKIFEMHRHQNLLTSFKQKVVSGVLWELRRGEKKIKEFQT